MRYIVTYGSGVQSQVARVKAQEELNRYAIARYLKDRDRYYNEEVEAVKAQNVEVVAYVNKRLSKGIVLSQIKIELGHAWVIWLRASKRSVEF